MNQANQTASTVAAKINNQEIIIISENTNWFIPIKPICNALGIGYSSQYQKLKEDEYLSSAIKLKPATGANGKTYQMVCIPFELVFGWLFTINPKNVAPEAKEPVRHCRMECYKALINHVHQYLSFIEEKQERLIEQLELVITALESPDHSKEQLNEAKKRYETFKADYMKLKGNKR